MRGQAGRPAPRPPAPRPPAPTMPAFGAPQAGTVAYAMACDFEYDYNRPIQAGINVCWQRCARQAGRSLPACAPLSRCACLSSRQVPWPALGPGGRGVVAHGPAARPCLAAATSRL
jgi:hypothetical protein